MATQEFESVQLAGATIEHLFGRVLVLTNETPLAPAQTKAPAAQEAALPAPEALAKPAPKPATMGTGSSGIVVVVNEPLSPVVSAEQAALLQKMFAAAQQSFTDLLVINAAGPALPAWDELLKQYTPTKVLLFNVGPQQMALPFLVPQYKPYQHGAVQYLLLPALNNYLGTGPTVQQEKRLLWTALQQMFGLNKA